LFLRSFRKKLPDYRGAQIAFELRVILDIDSIEVARRVVCNENFTSAFELGGHK